MCYVSSIVLRLPVQLLVEYFEAKFHDLHQVLQCRAEGTTSRSSGGTARQRNLTVFYCIFLILFLNSTWLKWLLWYVSLPRCSFVCGMVSKWWSFRSRPGNCETAARFRIIWEEKQMQACTRAGIHTHTHTWWEKIFWGYSFSHQPWSSPLLDFACSLLLHCISLYYWVLPRLLGVLLG